VFFDIHKAKFARITGVIETFATCRLYHIGHFLLKGRNTVDWARWRHKVLLRGPRA